jgi:hypothetical protein
LRIELVLLSISVEGVLPQPLHYETEVLRMLLGGLTIDENVIQVDHAEFIKIARAFVRPNSITIYSK